MFRFFTPLVVVLSAQCVFATHVMTASLETASLPKLAAPSNNCSNAATMCDVAGTAGYIFRALQLNTSTGVFTGTMITNQCTSDPRAFQFEGVSVDGPLGRAQCVAQSFPSVTVLPAAAPLRGAIGWTVTGTQVYGPFDAGFWY